MSIVWIPGSSVAWQNVVAETVTFTGLNGGTSYTAGQFVVLQISCNHGNCSPYTGVTLGSGGTTLAGTLLVGDGSTYTTSLWAFNIAATTVDQVVITSGTNNFSVIGVAAGILTGSATSSSATGQSTFGDQNSESLMTLQVGGSGANTTITVPASGIGIVGLYGRSGVAGSSLGVPTWSTTGSSNITSSSGDITNGLNTNPDWHSLAHTVTAGSWGPSASSSPAWTSNAAMVAVTFAQAPLTGVVLLSNIMM